ncbi:MAG: hypothetical protein WC364_11025 [Eubacteriales bacterium]|jgi:Zn-dependent peptidase ImmA (M78 family)
MRFPKTIKVGPYVMDVKYEEDLEYEGDATLGLFSSHDLEITLSADMNPQLEIGVFFHELVHAILWTTGANYSEEYSENLCTSLGNGLMAFFKENKIDLFKVAKGDK